MHIPGYRIERELGHGGMAIVYLALQESLHRHVALKVIKPILTTDEEFAQRFLREGRIIAQLSDPHIVTVYDIATHDNTYYLSMEYLSGGTLQQRIREGLPLEEARAIARAIASALNYAHRRGIIHRDIKPQNILFRENGAPVLTDFGIAKTLGSTTVMTRTGLSLGTPRYMSPEQIRGQQVDARADLYSFGVLFYEMLTGNVPFTADDSFALAMMHVTAPVPELPPQLSRFQPLLNRLLDKDPKQRFQSGQEFIVALDALEKAPVDLLAVTGPSRPVPTPAAPAARRFGWKSGALAAVLAGAALASGYWFAHRPASPPVVSTPVQPPAPPVVDLAAQRRAEADQLLAQARQRQQAGALEDSLTRIDQGLKLAPDHPALLALREEVSRQLAEATARKAREEQQIQAQLQAEQFLDQAQRSRQEGRLDLSLIHIEQGLQAVPDHPLLLALKQDVLARQTELTRREEAAERQRTEAERQKTETEQRRRKADELLARALDSQRNRAYETSLLQIEQGLQQVPDHSRLLALREEVRRQLREARTAPPPEPADQTAKIAALLRECDGHLKANRLTSGKGGNAADCYGEVLRRDRGNAAAVAGLDRIADQYAELAATAVRQGDVKAAKSSLDKLERLNRGDPRLADLREQLARAQKPASPPPRAVAEPEPAPSPARMEPPAEPAGQPPLPPGPAPQPGAPRIDLVSIPQPAGQPPVRPPVATVPETRIIAQDRHARLSRTETEDNVSLQVTVSPQGLLGERPPEPSARPRTAEQAWAALGNSGDPAEIERFLATYPRSRQASAARARLKALQQQQQSASAQLIVQANVEDAEISIDDRRIGTAPMQIEMKPGSYRVRVSREGYADWNGKVDLAAGDESTLQALLPRKPQGATAPRQAPDSSPEPVPASGAAPEPAPPPRAPETQTTAKATPGSNCIRGNCQNGEGSYRYPDGSEYTGDFRNARMHGQGTYVYAGRGEKYVGEWRSGVIDGQGTYYYRSGNRYAGEWRNGRKSGQGTYFYTERGDKYVGEFADDQPNGQGVYYYRNGDRYEGEWRNGRKHGQGVMYENGQKIVGEWQNDQKVRVTVQQ
jgi:serine/threonine-protein kinase PpkA